MLLVCLAGLVACGDASPTVASPANPTVASPASPIATTVVMVTTAATLPAVTVDKLIEGAATDFDRLQSLHMLLDIRQGKTQVNGIEVKKVEGDIGPGQYQAQVQVQVFVGSFGLPVIGIGSEQYMKDEFGNWSQSKPEQIVNLAVLLDPQVGLGSSLRKLSQPRLRGQETLPGGKIATYHIQGDLTGPQVSQLTFNKLGQRDVTLDAWIAQDNGQNRVGQLSIKEKVGGNGSDPSWWILNFSNFNAPINIQKPGK